MPWRPTSGPARRCDDAPFGVDVRNRAVRTGVLTGPCRAVNGGGGGPGSALHTLGGAIVGAIVGGSGGALGTLVSTIVAGCGIASA